MGKPASLGSTTARRRQLRDDNPAGTARRKSATAKSQAKKAGSGKTGMGREAITVFDLLIRALKEECGFSDSRAEKAAEAVALWANENGLSSKRYYWPVKFSQMSQDERDAEIRKRFNGSNLRALCEEYGVSRETIYRAVR